MGRCFVFFEPVEILYFPPKIGLVSSLLLFLVLFSVVVVEAVGSEGDLVAVFDDGFAGCQDMESAAVGVVDSELVGVQLEGAVSAVIHEHSGFGNCCPDRTVFKIFQEEYLCFLQ